ncbi:MAG TPA: hypothetical protein VNA11_19790 [Pseudonocardia sp.]|nr:hypothetical protein [Pseudonocardia sp.]
MSSDPTSQDSDGADVSPSMPLAADRPVVDGTQKTSEQLRAELEQMLAEDRKRTEEASVRAEQTVGELASRKGLSRTTAGADPVARLRAGKDEAVARVQHGVERARTAVPETASTVRHAVQEKAASLRTSMPEAASSVRHAVEERASSMRETAQQKPRALAVVAAAVVLLLLVRRLLARR